MSDDITFCFNKKCTHKKCERHPSNIKDYRIPHSFAFFDKCEYWNMSKQQIEKYLKEMEAG